MSSSSVISGGCQCGSVRYEATGLGRPSICHCRMCQKAFGSFFGPLVTTHDLTWTRGQPSWFQSSNKVRRGFCNQCGTPLAYDYGGPMEVSIGSLDNPELAEPVIEVNPADKLSFFNTLHDLPQRSAEDQKKAEAFMSDIESYQHSDEQSENLAKSE